MDETKDPLPWPRFPLDASVRPVIVKMDPAQATGAPSDAVAWVKRRRDDYIAAHGYTDPDTGALEFGGGAHAEAKAEYVAELDEIIEGLQALAEAAAQAPAAAGAAIVDEILAELARATRKFPTWPTDPLHAVAVLGEEYGELIKEMLQLTYESHKTNKGKVRMEALQAAAMALRLAMSLDRYDYLPGQQHSQQEPQT